MQKSKIENLIELLRSALVESSAKFNERELEQIAILVYDSMSNSGRTFHNINHINDVSQGLEGISVIAAIFHDIIYFQVDRGFRFSIEHKIYEYIDFKNDQFFIKEAKNKNTIDLHLIFGVKPGDTLNVFNGVNEFLSAAMAIDYLESILSRTQLIKLIALIESTIPFRKDPVDILVSRLKNIDYDTNEMDDLINRSIHFSNQDVINFADSDPRRFLNNTWNLISETNYSLRRDVDNYTIFDYRIALFKTYTFFKHLDHSLVFRRYKACPTENDWQKLKSGARDNIEIGKKYLSIQLLSIGAIEAIAELTGGNSPMSLFMGDVRRRDQKIVRVEDYLGEITHPKSDLDKSLIILLEDGRAQESSFDMKSSPIGAYLYRCLGNENTEILFLASLDYFDKKMTANDFLKKYPRVAISKIIHACAQISSTRRDELNKLNQLFL